MQKLKNKKLLLLPCLLIGLGYFSAISNIQVDDFWKSQIALLPFQLGAIAYFTYQRYHRRQHIKTLGTPVTQESHNLKKS